MTDTELTQQLTGRLRAGHFTKRLTGESGQAGMFMVYKPLARHLGGDPGDAVSVGNRFLVHPDGSFDPAAVPASTLLTRPQRPQC